MIFRPHHALALAAILLAHTFAGTLRADSAGIELGPWHYAGPFKDKAFGLVRKAFVRSHGPEEQALAAGANPIDLNKTV